MGEYQAVVEIYRVPKGGMGSMLTLGMRRGGGVDVSGLLGGCRVDMRGVGGC